MTAYLWYGSFFHFKDLPKEFLEPPRKNGTELHLGTKVVKVGFTLSVWPPFHQQALSSFFVGTKHFGHII